MIWTRDRIVGKTRLLFRESSRKTLPEIGSSIVLRIRSAATSVKKSTPRTTLTFRHPVAVLTDAYEMNWSTVSILRTPESPKILMFAEPPASTCRHDGHASQNSPGPWSPRQLPALATAAANASLAPSSLPTRRYACASRLETRAASRHRVAGQSPTASLIRFADTDYISLIINSGSVTLVSGSLSSSAQGYQRQVYTPLPACAMSEFRVDNEQTGRQSPSPFCTRFNVTTSRYRQAVYKASVAQP